MDAYANYFMDMRARVNSFFAHSRGNCYSLSGEPSRPHLLIFKSQIELFETSSTSKNCSLLTLDSGQYFFNQSLMSGEFILQFHCKCAQIFQLFRSRKVNGHWCEKEAQKWR